MSSPTVINSSGAGTGAGVERYKDYLAQVRRSVRLQRKAMDRAVNHYAAAGVSTCVLATDTSELESTTAARDHARLLLYTRGWRLAFNTASNVGDHLSAVADVAVEGQPRVFAHATLARAALEGAARICYILHSKGSLEDRVLRSAALLLASADEHMKAARELQRTGQPIAPKAIQAAQRGLDDLRVTLRTAGIHEHRGRDGVKLLGVSITGVSSDRVESSPNISALLSDLLPEKPGAYRFGSGVVHSQAWMIDDESAFDVTSRRLEWQFDPSALASSVDLAIAGAKLVIGAFAAMLGQDPTREFVEAQRREEAVSRLAASLLGLSR